VKFCTVVLGEDITHCGNWKLQMESRFGNGAHLDYQPKGALQKMMYAVELNVSLKSLEGERNQIYKVDRTREDFTENIKNLQVHHIILQSEYTCVEIENQNLQWNVKK
jgi:hypothetical protein